MSVVIGLGALLLALFIYAFWIEPAWRLRVVHYRLPLEGWGARAPLRIAILADLHVGAPHLGLRRLRRIVDRANAQKADLAVVLGDLSAEHPFVLGKISKAEIAQVLTSFSAPLGTYSVLGNHDWWQDPSAIDEGRPPEAATALVDAGLPLLDNDAVKLRTGADGFWLVGLADQRPISLDPVHDGFDDLEAAMAQVTDEAPAILLAHEPDIFPDLPGQIALTLSGHTHGGQIRLFGMSPVIMAVECEKFAYGHYTHGAQSLVVSGGLGCSDWPVRLNMPPEITMVEVCGTGAR